MNEQVKVNIKQRIVGAIVLVSLGVIVIPMLLDGGKDQQQGISNSNIPILPSHLDKKIAPVAEPKPGYKARPVLVRPVDELTRESTETLKSKTLSNKAPAIQSNNAEAARVKAAKVKTKPEQTHKTELIQSKKAQTKKELFSEKKASSAAVHYDIVSKPKTSRIDTAYTIQVGSFKNKSNAFTLRDKLRKDKFRAYIESVSISAGLRYRVRIGPFLKYDEVKQNRAKLIQRYKLKGTIIKYKT
jgi:DedD protein